MFGWEFPPFFAGGVGMVCYELTRQLVKDGVSVQYVMPFIPEDLHPDFLRMYDANKLGGFVELDKFKIKINKVHSLLAAYQTEKEYLTSLKEKQKRKFSSSNDNTYKLYGENMFDEIELFEKRVQKMFHNRVFDEFDVIHSHDWTTVPAALEIKRLSGKPLAIHVHITEFNKTGNNTANPAIYEIEKKGFENADKIVAVSNLIKETIIRYYGIDPEKIEVIHNGGIEMDSPKETKKEQILGDKYNPNDKVVLFAGRVTGMKGPIRFVEMANLVLKQKPNTLFVIAGSGDQLDNCINRAHELKIENKFHFFGFYTKEDAEKLYDLADVFVLPSQMEPFGVTPLEAMSKNTPVVLSKQSGVAEVLNHVLFNDFWDIEKMASNVASLLTYTRLHKKLKIEGFKESKAIDWKKPAKECEKLYEVMS